MDKTLTSRGLLGRASTGNSKRGVLGRLGIPTLLLALCLVGLQASALAQSECLDACQQALANCLRMGQGDPAAEAICEDVYDNCCEMCMGL